MVPAFLTDLKIDADVSPNISVPIVHNQHVNKVRLTAELLHGALKSRFQCLANTQDPNEVGNRILACVNLWNFGLLNARATHVCSSWCAHRLNADVCDETRHTGEQATSEDADNLQKLWLKHRNRDDKCAAAKCREPSTRDIKWIQCDFCFRWWHFVCAGIKGHRELNSEYICRICEDPEEQPTEVADLTEEEEKRMNKMMEMLIANNLLASGAVEVHDSEG